MKKATAIILAAVLLISFAACGNKDKTENTTSGSTKPTATTEQTTEKQNNTEEKTDYDSIPDEMTAQNGKYEIAFVTDVGQLKDKSFNQGTWNGVKYYAYKNKKSYKYYQPANGDKATDEDRYDAMKAAADGGGEIIFATGFLQGSALKKIAEEYPEKKFVFIDGEVLKGKEGKALMNIAAVDFNEEQSGFLAGFAAVKEGFTKLGFSGGGGGSNPPCCRFGYGFVQGAEAAAREEDTEVEINYSWDLFPLHPSFRQCLTDGTRAALKLFLPAAVPCAFLLSKRLQKTRRGLSVLTLTRLPSPTLLSHLQQRV